MISEGQKAWSMLLEDIKNVEGWPYPPPFHQIIGLFRQMILCYDNNLLDASVILGRAIIDGAIFDAVINPPFPTNVKYLCMYCKKEISGGLNRLEAHESMEHHSTKQWREERIKFLTDTLNKKLKEFSKNKEYKNYTDSWGDYDKTKEIGLKNVAVLSGLLDCNELEKINESIRLKAAVRLHRVAREKAYEKWKKENAEKMKLLSENKIEANAIDWFNWEFPDKNEAKNVLVKTEHYLGLIIKRYVDIWK